MSGKGVAYVVSVKIVLWAEIRKLISYIMSLTDAGQQQPFISVKNG